MKIRHFILPLFLAIPLLASAAAAPLPGSANADQKMFEKLNAAVGTWTCVDTPASKKPDVITIAREGKYFVARETGDNPGTQYTRWSHTFQRYVSTTLNDNGAIYVQHTISKDPMNATWTYDYPASLPKGQLYPVSSTLTGHIWNYTGKYMDANGTVHTATSICTKK